MEAAGGGHLETVELLLNSGADLNHKDKVSQQYTFHYVAHNYDKLILRV